MTDEERVFEVLNGKTRIWRFTPEEQSGSSDAADRLLWLGMLRAEHELAAALFGRVSERADASARKLPVPYRFLKGLAQPGRNTVLDADSGKVRFIDPRITLNDPDGPLTPVSRLGARREDLPEQMSRMRTGGGCDERGE